MTTPITAELAAAFYVTCGRNFDRVHELAQERNPDYGQDGCGQPVAIADAYRCTECGCWFHLGHARKHFEIHAAARVNDILRRADLIKQHLDEIVAKARPA